MKVFLLFKKLRFLKSDLFIFFFFRFFFVTLTSNSIPRIQFKSLVASTLKIIVYIQKGKGRDGCVVWNAAADGLSRKSVKQEVVR